MVRISHCMWKLPRIITQTSAVTHCKTAPFYVQIHSGSPSLTLRCEIIPKLPRKDNKTSCMTDLVCNTISFSHSSHTQRAVIPTPCLTPLQQSHHHGWVTSALSCTVFLVGNRNQGRKAWRHFTGSVCMILRRQTKGISWGDWEIFTNHGRTATWDLHHRSSQGFFCRACYEEHNFQNEIT